MKRFAIGVALASTALAGAAQARDKSWYIGLEGGGMIAQSESFDLTTTGATPRTTENALRNRYEVGYDAGGVMGYDFGGLRAEFEVAYKDANLDAITVNGAIPAIPGGGCGLQSQGPGCGLTGVPPAGTYDSADGNARILSFMMNFLLDFGGGDESRFGAFVGGGAGIARTQAHIWQLAKFGTAFADDSDTGFAWQGIAGFRYALSEKVDLGLKYRYFNVNSVDLQTANGLDLSGKFRSHSLLAGITFNLFEPEAPPPPPPPPPAVTPGPFLVFFDWDRFEITPEAAAILDRAVEAYMQTGQTSVVLAGHTDTSGSASYNMGLSQRRADAVKAYMAAKGIPESQMTTQAFGQERLLVETPDNVREPQNRRVEITFGGRM